MTKVIVYTSGNCGSKSVSQALKDANVEHYYGHRIQHLLDTRRHVYDEIMDPESTWKVITLVRNPLHWSLSLLARRLDQGNATKAELKFEDYCHILGWFDFEFKPLFDIDVYLKPNRIKKYGVQFCESDKAKILIIKTEYLDLTNGILSSFLEHSITIPHINQWQNKCSVLQNYKVPQGFAEAMKDSKYWRYFYG